ncbi:polyhydroxyalkanoate depolymerase [Aureimonas pseudogalii]|uniref:Poly(3-hydroxybutyrate) depolymerase n=1 Tax=Aureimonas pseudogalii TaxID=1744844 RepID=A0A7W6EE89_9HYPH|nr:poly(3-hydroxybutyrate) depolymerase [Aureimonas pseudogalii]
MLYEFYEWNHAMLAPMRAVADATRLIYGNPLNPLAHTGMGRTVAAMAEVFERSTRVYGKPEWGLHDTFVDGMRVPVVDRVVWEKPFARLLHFERELPAGRRADPRFLIVAPMSGHYATLLRGTVEALLPYGDVHITDWTDARTVPVAAGRFDLDDYVDYVIEMLRFLGPDTHVIGVCQPAVPVMMAVARMEEDEDPCSPATMTLMGGPIDTRINPTGVNKLAESKGIDWFKQNVIMKVPFPQPGFLREVYPGFLQLTGFMSMNLDRHLIAHKEFFLHLVKHDGDPAEKHRAFYDEYNAVMDLTAEFYLQTVDEVFIKHSLPKGEITHRGHRLDMAKIRRTALLTVEGENDDISGVGQTQAAQTLCSSLPDDMRVHYLQPKVGHYGVFNGSRFRAEIAPRIVDFALTHGGKHGRAPVPVPDRSAEAREPALQPPEALDAAQTQPLAFAAPEAVADDAPAAEVAATEVPTTEVFATETAITPNEPEPAAPVETPVAVADGEAEIVEAGEASALHGHPAHAADTALVPPVLELPVAPAAPPVLADLEAALGAGAEPVPSILPEGFLDTAAGAPTIKGSPKLVKAATRPRRKR